MSYSVLHVQSGVTKDISDFVTGIEYGGEMASAVRKMDISVLSGTDAFIPRLNIKNGDLLVLRNGDSEIMRGIIFRQDRDDKGALKLTAYTHAVYLVKNKDTNRFEQIKASQIAAEICRDFGIPAGKLEDTRIIFPKLIFRDKTLWDIIVTALTETTKQSGIKYRVYFKEGKLNIVRKSSQSVYLVLKEGGNLLAASASASIEDMKNQIKLVGKLTGQDGEETELMYTAQNEEMQKLYGIMQETHEESGDNINRSTIRQIAETMLKELCREEIEADIEAMGLDEVEAGAAVRVTEPVTGLSGVFYVDQDSHTIEGARHTMKLKLTRTGDVPDMEYEE